MTGRNKGFMLGTDAKPDKDMNISYSYGDKGLLNAVTDANGTYTRVEGSNMIATTTYVNTGHPNTTDLL